MAEERPPILGEEIERRLESLPRGKRQAVRDILRDLLKDEPEQAREPRPRPRFKA